MISKFPSNDNTPYIILETFLSILVMGTNARKPEGNMNMNFQRFSLFLFFECLIIQELFCFVLVWKHNYYIRARSVRAANTTPRIGSF